MKCACKGPDCKTVVRFDRYAPAMIVEAKNKPDILININDLKIPVEVKSRKYGYFFIYAPESGNCQICHCPSSKTKIYRPIRELGIENFNHQVRATLENYGISLFLINGHVRPKSPLYRTNERGLVILSELETFDTALNRAYGFLY